jgi:hypothetical protein
MMTYNIKAQPVIVTNNKTGEIKEFTSARKAAEYIGLHHSYIANCLLNQAILRGKIYNIEKKII